MFFVFAYINDWLAWHHLWLGTRKTSLTLRESTAVQCTLHPLSTIWRQAALTTLLLRLFRSQPALLQLQLSLCRSSRNKHHRHCRCRRHHPDYELLALAISIPSHPPAMLSTCRSGCSHSFLLSARSQYFDISLDHNIAVVLPAPNRTCLQCNRFPSIQWGFTRRDGPFQFSNQASQTSQFYSVNQLLVNLSHRPLFTSHQSA